jgi:hypothetical protein
LSSPSGMVSGRWRLWRCCIVGTIFVDVARIVSTVVIIIHSSDAACIVGIVVIIPLLRLDVVGSYLSSSSLSAFP